MINAIREYRVSSKEEDSDVQSLSQRLINNQVDHQNFNPHLFEKKTVRRIK